MSIEKRRLLFLVNDTLEFDPEKKILKRVDDNSFSEIKLNTPTSECLYLILSRGNQIIPQDEFFKTVWESNGEYVSLNTLYQNISILRKGLKELGIADEIITTVAKKGFKLHSDVRVSIREKKSETSSETSHNNKNERQYRISSGTLGLIALSLVLIGLVIMIFYQSIRYFAYSPKEVDYGYTETAMVDGCHIYTFNVNRKKKELDINVIKRLIEEYPINCSINGHLYVNWQEYSNYYSVITCNKPVTTDSIVDCKTIFYEG